MSSVRVIGVGNVDRDVEEFLQTETPTAEMGR